MANAPNQKLKTLYLLDIFTTLTDENHPLTMSELIDRLSHFSITAERKSIYSDISLLEQYGCQIKKVKTKTTAYYLAKRSFELSELKLLTDAILSAKFLTAAQSKTLTKKLASLTSIQQAKELKRQIIVADRAKSFKENIFLNIDTITLAINDGKKILFKYFDFNIKKQIIHRKNGDNYHLTPLSLCWNEDKYYLLCYNAKYDSINHFRVDRMTDIHLSFSNIDPIVSNRFNLTEHINQTFGMYNGTPLFANIWFHKDLANAVIDKFGSSLTFIPSKNGFHIFVHVSNSPVFLSWLFQFGKQAKILSPQCLKDSMKNLIQEQLDQL